MGAKRSSKRPAYQRRNEGHILEHLWAKWSPQKNVIRNMLRDHRLDFILIQETKMRKEAVESISFSRSLEGFSTNLDGASGGFLTLYNSNLFNSHILYGEGNILLIQVENIKNKVFWYLLKVYAPNTKNGRRNYWVKIKNVLSRFYVGICIIMGDFNTPLRDDKNRGAWL